MEIIFLAALRFLYYEDTPKEGLNRIGACQFRVSLGCPTWNGFPLWANLMQIASVEN